MAKSNQIKYIDGFTESAWKSLVIKSLRIGWPKGIEEAETHLAPSKIRTLLLGSMFEDTWPYDLTDLEHCYQAILNRHYAWLCSRNTLHGRGYADKFCDMADEACSPRGTESAKVMARTITEKTSITWINPRIYNCLYTWGSVPHTDNFVFRPTIDTGWKGMPLNILDEHTLEGKFKKQKVTLTSGHYENHRAIGKRVMNEGWEPIQREFENDRIVSGWGQQSKLF